MSTPNTIHKSKITQLLLWLAPTGIEAVVYVIITLVVLLISNLAPVQELLAYPSGFNLHHAAIDSIDGLLRQFLGARLAASIATGIFWGFVGAVVYILFWLFGNYSTEVSNDLTISKFTHPKNVSVYSPLQTFVSKVIFQLIVLITFIFFINLCTRVMLPLITASFSDLVDYWPRSNYIIKAGWGGLALVLLLHSSVVMTRLLTLRKRVFGAN